MRHILLSLLIMISVAGCDDDFSLHNKCFEGTAIDYNCCNGITKISLTKHVPGSKTMTINGTEYENVILVPGSLEDTHFYITLKKYNPKTDSDQLDGVCYCMVGSDEVPNYTIVTQSNTICP